MIDDSRPVRVFRNWKRGCYSIMQGTRLVSASEVTLSGVEFRVRESGRQRMLRSGKKNVHAYAVGQLIEFVPVGTGEMAEPTQPVGRPISYDAQSAGSFVDSESKAPVARASRAHFGAHGATYQAEQVILDHSQAA